MDVAAECEDGLVFFDEFFVARAADVVAEPVDVVEFGVGGRCVSE